MSGLYSPHNFLGIYAYPTHSLSLSCSLNPSFFHYLFWLGVFCDSLISLLSPLQSLSVQACLYSPSFAEPFTSPAHFFMQVFEHTQTCARKHTCTGFIPTHLLNLSSPFILSLERKTLVLLQSCLSSENITQVSTQVLPDWFSPGYSYISYSICSKQSKIDGMIIGEHMVHHSLVAF